MRRCPICFKCYERAARHDVTCPRCVASGAAWWDGVTDEDPYLVQRAARAGRLAAYYGRFITADQALSIAWWATLNYGDAPTRRRILSP